MRMRGNSDNGGSVIMVMIMMMVWYGSVVMVLMYLCPLPGLFKIA